MGIDQVSIIAENIINQQQKIIKLEQELKELKFILKQLSELELLDHYEIDEYFRENLNDIKKILLQIVSPIQHYASLRVEYS